MGRLSAITVLLHPKHMKIAPAIIDFTGMRFKRERAIDERLRRSLGVRPNSRQKKNLTRNVRGALGTMLGW